MRLILAASVAMLLAGACASSAPVTASGASNKIVSADSSRKIFREISTDLAKKKTEDTHNAAAAQSPNGDHNQNGDFIAVN